MVKYFIIRSIRNILKQKQSVFVNVLCLSLGFSVFILLMRYVQYENTWDKENPNYDRIYRVNKIVKSGDSEREFEINHFPLAAALKSELPEIEESANIRSCGSYLSADANKVIFENNGFFASNSIFAIFPFKIIDGDINSMLSKPYSIVLSKTLAAKLFQNQNPVGKTVFGGSKELYTVTGLMDDVPENRNIRPSYLISAITEETRNNLTANWSNQSNYWTFVLLKNNTQVSLLNQKINQVFWKHKDKTKESLFLKPLAKLHLETTSDSDLKYVPLYYAILAFLTLLLASVNYANLSNVSSMSRLKEVGIMKIHGGNRLKLVAHFMSEGAFLSFLALLIAIGIVYIFLPVFNQIVDRSITIAFAQNISFYVLIIVATLVVGLLSNIYPALILSSYNPLRVLNSGANVMKNNKSKGRQMLLVFQFFIATAIVSSSLWIYNHVSFMANKSLGYNEKDIIFCQIPKNNSTISFDDLRNRIMSNPDVSNVSYSKNTPMHSNWTEQIYKERGNLNSEIITSYNVVSYDFLDTYQIKISEGRNFLRDFESDKTACIINEKCVKALGWSNPIDKEIIAFDKAYKIIGVVKDFHNTSVHDEIRPYFMVLSNGKINNNFDLAIKISSQDKAQTIQYLNNTLNSIFNDALFVIGDFHDTIDDEGMVVWKSIKQTFLFFSLLAVLIALFGLYGLVSFSAKKRIKEIGIRKVQGSTVSQIFVLINKEYFFLLAIALTLGLPSLNIMAEMAPGAYKYQIELMDYVLVVALLYAVALITSGWQSWRAATRNPVEALRSE